MRRDKRDHCFQRQMDEESLIVVGLQWQKVDRGQLVETSRNQCPLSCSASSPPRTSGAQKTRGKLKNRWAFEIWSGEPDHYSVFTLPTPHSPVLPTLGSNVNFEPKLYISFVIIALRLRRSTGTFWNFTTYLSFWRKKKNIVKSFELKREKMKLLDNLDFQTFFGWFFFFF